MVFRFGVVDALYPLIGLFERIRLFLNHAIPIHEHEKKELWATRFDISRIDL